MKVLAVETATSWQSVAIVEPPTVLAQVDQAAEGAHAKLLIPTIDRLLQQTSLTLEELDAFFVSIGPGSFTGLRVGLATVLGFRAVLGKPIVAVPTLEALAWNLRSVPGLLCPMLKSRRGELYWACYQWESAQTLTVLRSPSVGTFAEFVDTVQSPMTVVGEGWQTCGEALQGLLGSRATWLVPGPLSAMPASAVSVALAGMARLMSGDVAPQGVAPLYVQRAEAEVQWEKKHGRAPQSSAS
jgi:tRNA threonylcarbamoyladenosine biosynthesis protein TsaB